MTTTLRCVQRGGNGEDGIGKDDIAKNKLWGIRSKKIRMARRSSKKRKARLVEPANL
jgi:hypothetical protein